MHREISDFMKFSQEKAFPFFLFTHDIMDIDQSRSAFSVGKIDSLSS